jgi:glutamine amidotransferase
MCRWLAYTGNPIHIEDLLFRPEHNLIDQSMSSKSKETPTNGDGFGVGWYGKREAPGLFRSIRPAWNDSNLRDLAAQIESPLFLAHVRATSLATVQETNCHPFRHGRWLFVHNGQIDGIEKFRRDLLHAVDPEIFENILGSTDSELMFHLALTFGLAKDPLRGLQRMAGFVEKTARAHGVKDAIWMTLGLADGESLHAVRYASDGDAPTLYHTPDMEQVRSINPAVSSRFGEAARAVVSEPIGKFGEMWTAVGQARYLRVRGGTVESKPFRPEMP